MVEGNHHLSTIAMRGGMRIGILAHVVKGADRSRRPSTSTGAGLNVPKQVADGKHYISHQQREPAVAKGY
jgi:hypothetical protein